MFSLAIIVVGVIATLNCVAVAAPQPQLEQRQSGFNAIQNWANDFADVEFNNNAGGNFNVTWDNNPGGNFVVGKGYRPGRDM
jgi:endo-1,4-beta-xylanase